MIAAKLLIPVDDKQVLRDVSGMAGYCKM
jgi:hypothetical protein